MHNKNRFCRLCCTILDFIEITIPTIMLVSLFVAFIVGIVFRYIFRDPQAWTFELSSITFLQLAILSACYVQREDSHIVFDMVYEKMTIKAKCLMRILGGIIIVFTSSFLVPVSIKYVAAMIGLTTQVMRWPRWCVFASFPLTFIIIDLRAFYRLLLDILSLIKGDYKKNYAVQKEGKVS